MGIDEARFEVVAVPLDVEDAIGADSDILLDDTTAEVTATVDDPSAAPLVVEVGLSVINGAALSDPALLGGPTLLDGSASSFPQAPGKPSQINAMAL